MEDCAIACSKSLRATRMRLELCKYCPGRIRHDEADYVRPGLSNFRAPLIVRSRQARFQAGRMENSRGQCKRIDRVANKVGLYISEFEIIDEVSSKSTDI